MHSFFPLLRRIFPFLLVISIATPVFGQEADRPRRSLGPLLSEEGSPVQQLAITPVTEGTDVLAAGRLQSSVWLGYSNVFEQDSTPTHVLLIDFERLVTVPELRLGLSRNLEIGGRLMFETTGGGILDQALVSWHNFLGVGNANRERFPSNQHVVRLENGDGETILDAPETRSFRLRDVRVLGKWRALGSDTSSTALSVRGTARFPVHSHRRIEERIDVGASVIGRLSAARWHGHAMAGWATVRSELAGDGDVLRDHAYHAMLGLERSIGRRWAAVAQFQIVSAVLSSFSGTEVDGLIGNLVFGVAGRSDHGWSWDLSFQEDIPAETPGIDFTIGIKISKAWSH